MGETAADETVLLGAGRPPGSDRPAQGGEASIPVSGVHQWLTTLLRDLPKPTEYRYTADYTRAVVDYCLEKWLAAHPGAAVPSVEEAGAQFREGMLAAEDLSELQVDQVCNRTFGLEDELAAWLCGTTERFLNLVRPWTPVWLSFTDWALRWSRQNSIETLVFLARDALPFYVAASALEQGPHLHLAHVSRAVGPDPVTVNSILRRPSIALIDSGCYGTLISELQQRRGALVENAHREGAATLFYYSRNPRLFGYVNYVMSKDMVTSPEAMNRAGDFVIYAGDLLEAMPKPYQYHRHDRSMVELSDLVSFTVSIAVLSEMQSLAKASAFLDSERLTDVHEQVRLLFRAYELSTHRSELRSGFPFDEPTPKSVPSAASVADLDFLEIPPQSHVFGTVSG
ncbi:hypothetical protein J4573_20450 [Actinomadura barringtoniae]|uniref:Uncharacterized protein n=1 Tax=Actinomadura barringtoniae TaxID=1427535 RepID=A0A939T4J0_9ACTN|nr:hypothetical protein [Actinomadura barringtoniae]MBO2449483.1 hypothetical protein [Actinomadura barringtoniae]